MKFIEHLLQEGRFAKETYRQRKVPQTIQALTDEYIDMIDIHGGIEEMGLDWHGADDTWGEHFEHLMDHLTDIHADEVIKKVKEHYNV